VSSRPLHFPSFSVAHLDASEAPPGSELWALAGLVGEGFTLGVTALPAVIEASWYRLGGTPARLAALYRGLDPADPDEDILEEAWEAAEPLLAQTYLLDDVVDALLESFSELLRRGSGAVVMRRQGERGRLIGEASERSLLLALKRLYRDEWSPERVAARLASTARLGIDAAPVLIHRQAVAKSQAAGDAATRLLGRRVLAGSDAAGGIVAVGDAATS